MRLPEEHPMLTPFRRRLPRPPAAGRTKVADPRTVLRGWLAFGVLAAVSVALLWPFGLGSAVDRMRRQFVAIGYLQAATSQASGKPVRRAEALQALNRAVALAPDNPLVAEQAAELYVNLRAYEEAIPRLQKERRRSLLASVSLGQCLLMVGRTEEGRSILDRALSESESLRRTHRLPDRLYALVMNNVGYVYALAGEDLPEARAFVQSALKLRPLQPAYEDSMGWVEYRLGRYQDAAFYLERAVRQYLPGESAEMDYHLGAAYARLGRWQAARRSLERCLELDDSWQEARQELKQLGQNLPPPAVAGAVVQLHG